MINSIRDIISQDDVVSQDYLLYQLLYLLWYYKLFTILNILIFLTIIFSFCPEINFQLNPVLKWHKKLNIWLIKKRNFRNISSTIFILAIN
jgi:hypothetical protein